MTFQFKRLEIHDVILVQPKAFADERGFFMECYKRSEFGTNGIPDTFVQDNHSHSVSGVLRGLHYQRHPKAQAKLVMVLQGEIYDVAADIRRGSPTYGRSVGVRLSSRDHRMLYVPVGFAHGFCVLSDEADVVYKVTEEYSPELEGGIRWNDPELGIAWPVQTPILSSADARLGFLQETGSPFDYRKTVSS